MTLSFQEVMTLVVVVGTGIGTTLVQIYRENRNRRWDLQDREDARTAQLTRDLALAAKVEEAREKVAESAADAKQLIVQKIDENTEISRLAFNAANNFHEKTSKLELAFDRVQSRSVSSDAIAPHVIADIKGTVEDTNSRVREIETIVHPTDPK